MKNLAKITLLLAFFTSQKSYSLPAHVIAQAAGKTIGALGGQNYSNNLNQALNDACGPDLSRCTMKQVCTYMRVVNTTIDCSTMPDIIAQPDPKAIAFESFLRALPKPDSCIRHEQMSLKNSLNGALMIGFNNPVFALGSECASDKESYRNYALSHSAEIFASLGL